MSDLITSLISDWKQQRPDLKAESMAITGRILRLAHFYEQEIAKTLKPFNLQYSELDVLATLRRKGNPFELSPKQLMLSVVLTSGAMTACLDRLEKRELIQRAADPNDRRGRVIRLTTTGISLVDEAIEARFEQAEEGIIGLSDPEQKELVELLSKLTQSVGV